MRNISFMSIVFGIATHGFCQQKIGSIEMILPSVVYITTAKVHTQIKDGNEWEVYLRNPKTGETKPDLHFEIGSGFLVGKEIDHFLVTAQHVARTTNANTSVIISDDKGEAQEVKMKDLVDRKYLDGNNLQWIDHPIADVSVLPIFPIGKSISIIPNETILNRLEAPLRQRNLIVYGYPLGLGAGKRISPISKKYSPASDLLALNRADTNKPATFFLIDDPSIGGFSGGPVVAFPQDLEFGDGTAISVSGMFVLGLVHGTINKDGGGFGAIVPSKFIAETIDLAPGFTGKYSFKYPDGRVWSEVIYKNGNPWEVISNFKKDGTQQEKGTLKNGSGTRLIYDENGNLFSIRQYSEGVKIKEDRASSAQPK